MSPLRTSNGHLPTSVSSLGPKFAVIGAGSRGNAYGRAVSVATEGSIVAVADISEFKRRDFGRKYIWGDNHSPAPGQEFSGWREFVDWAYRKRQGNGYAELSNEYKVDGVFICTLDHTHAEIIHAIAPLGLHILCEKPLALTLSDCISISRSLQPGGPNVTPEKIVSIGHVLRYSPHNQLLRRLVVEDQAIGDIVSIEHTEPIGWWHFSHSYVRGNWRRSTPDGVGSLLTKSCHDIDFLMWLLSSPADAASDPTYHVPSTIFSAGTLTHFRKSRKPKSAGTATNCSSCAIAEKDAVEGGCNFSAFKIYRDRWLRKEKDAGWPLNIVVPEIEDVVRSAQTPEIGWGRAEEVLTSKLGEDYDVGSLSDDKIAERGWYGRCVYESDNNVVDDQTVVIRWDEDVSGDTSRRPKTALFHMTYPTQAQCERRGRIYGTHGEISYDSKTITVYTFAGEKVVTHTIPKQAPEVEKAHGGGDWGLAKSFVSAVAAAQSGEMKVEDSQRRYIGADLEEIILSHAVVFAAEEARHTGQNIDFGAWWSQKIKSRWIE